jgi:hypothetical protein
MPMGSSGKEFGVPSESAGKSVVVGAKEGGL